jgi:hypothetical protein
MPRPFEKGNPGKPKGAVSKTTKLVKEVFAEVFTELQSDPTAKLSAWGKQNPTEFYKLASKLIPIQIAGDPENPLSFTLKGALGFENDNTEPEV